MGLKWYWCVGWWWWCIWWLQVVALFGFSSNSSRDSAPWPSSSSSSSTSSSSSPSSSDQWSSVSLWSSKANKFGNSASQMEQPKCLSWIWCWTSFFPLRKFFSQTLHVNDPSTRGGKRKRGRFEMKEWNLTSVDVDGLDGWLGHFQQFNCDRHQVWHRLSLRVKLGRCF